MDAPPRFNQPGPAEETVEAVAEDKTGKAYANEVDIEYRRKSAQHEAAQKLKRELSDRRIGGELSPVADAYLQRLTESIRTGDQLDDIPDPDPLIDGWLSLDSLSWIAGPSGTYKSFLALDLAARYGSDDMTYHGEDMSHGRALYFIAEGATMFKHRKNAWQEHNDRIMTGVDFIPSAIQLSDLDVAMPALIALAVQRKHGLIIFDTQAMCTVGADESDNTDMGVTMNALHSLREATGACVLLVHHFGKDTGSGMRGASAMYAAATTVIATRKKDGILSLSTVSPLGKQKDEQERNNLHFLMEPVSPEDGRMSLVPVRDMSFHIPESLPELTSRDLIILRAISDTGVIGLNTADIARIMEEREPKRRSEPGGQEKWMSQNAKKWMNKLLSNGTAVKTGANYVTTPLARECIEDGS